MSSLQMIIGTDKNNPNYSVFKDEIRNELQLFSGITLLEVVPDEKDTPQHRFLAARLYNYNIKLSLISKHFGYCYRSIKKWGETLQRGTPEELVKVIEGRNRPKKFTAEVKGFATYEFKRIYPTNRKSYSYEIRNSIKEVFGYEISAETLRPLFSILKSQYKQENEELKKKVIEFTIKPAQLALPAHKELLCLPLLKVEEESNSANNLMISNTETEVQHSDIEKNKDSKSQLKINNTISYGFGFCYHLGILLFVPLLSQLKKKGLHFISQWIISVLLEAKNIEQTKELSFSSLEIILEKPIKSPKHQRIFIKNHATSTNIENLLRFNLESNLKKEDCDFYYDPHSKHYTGMRNILKGWCSKVRMADKALYMDFIHSCDGFPLYFDIADNFDDIRVRFFRQEIEFRRLGNISEDKELTFIIDRAIFSTEVFLQVLDRKNLHIITWEKGYNKDQWEADSKTSTFLFISRTGNEKTDKRFIKYQYQEKQWDKNTSIRQIIVRVYKSIDNQNFTNEVSILSDDFNRSAVSIIEAIFNRWIQENDFKYCIEHFGLDQIASYDYEEYQEIKDEVKDKEYISGQYKSLTKEIESLRGKLKTTLYKLHRLNLKEKEGKKLSEKQNQNKQNLINLSKSQTLSLEKLEEQRNNTQKEVSKIEELIKQKKAILKTDVKKFMDCIKIIARNSFYTLAKDFRENYNDYRDDLTIMRAIVQSNGIIKNSDNFTEIQLMPVMDLTPKMRKTVEFLIEKINENENRMPNYNYRKPIRFSINGHIDQMFAFSF